MAFSTDPYETPGGYRSAINKQDTSQDADILIDLKAVSRYLERKLGGRCFNQDIATSRTYYGTGSRALFIDDLVSVTAVASDDNQDGVAEVAWTVTQDYQLRPLNAAAWVEPEPYTSLFVPLWSSKVFPAYRMITITGTWGWPGVPVPIRRACGQLTAILRMEGPRASRSMTPDGEILEANPQAQGIIRELMRSYTREGF